MPVFHFISFIVFIVAESWINIHILLIFSLIRFGFSLTSYGDINTCIYTLLKAPLAALGASPFTMIVMILMCSIMWFFGLHGGMIVMPFINMLYMPLAMENLTAYGAGAELPNIIVKSAWGGYASLGGAGGTASYALSCASWQKVSATKLLESWLFLLVSAVSMNRLLSDFLWY